MEDISKNRKAYLYQNVNDISCIFSFEYGKLLDDTPLIISFPTDQYASKEVTINGIPGDLYISLLPDESHGLVWIDEKNAIYYSISAYFDAELIVEIAESVELKK